MSRPAASAEPLVCPTCAKTYPLDERFCPTCKMPLVYAGFTGTDHPITDVGERARKIKPQYSEGELVRVAGARNQSEAEFIQGMLLEEGIPSVQRRSRGFDVPDFLAAGPRDIVVAASGADAAREILGVPATMPRGPLTRPTWVRVLAIVLAIVSLLVIATFVVGAALAQARPLQTGQVRAPRALCVT